MSSTFPVIHSILDAQALAAEVGRRYDIQPVSCHLISRGSNDIYRLRSGDAGYAVRVQRAGWRTDADLGYELELVQFLASRGLPVVPALTGSDGTGFFSLNAPEGSRAVTVSAWLGGMVLSQSIDGDTAAAVGRLTADIHNAALEFTPAHVRQIDTARKILAHRQALSELLGHRPADEKYFDASLDWITARIAALPPELPRTHTHGDVHFGNIFRRADGDLVLLDFDDCGEDYALKDLMGFVWRNQIERLSPVLVERFVAGYESRRPLVGYERSSFALLLAARHLYLLATLAGTINRMGPVPGFDADIEHYLLLAREHLAAAGFSD